MELQREFPFLTPWALGRLRREKKIPYIKVGHRTYVYDINRVRQAVARLEIKEVA
jgi:hypothetical protein